MNKYEAIGIVEAKHFTTALNIIDIMCKQCQVELLCIEKYLGGRLVSTIVAGDISNVTEAIEIVKRNYNYDNEIVKNAVVITSPHENIMKFIVKNEEFVKDEKIIKEEVSQEENLRNVEMVKKVKIPKVNKANKVNKENKANKENKVNKEN